MHRLRVTIPDTGFDGYEVVIGTGLLGQIADRVAQVAPAACYAIIADATVAALYGPGVEASFERSGLRATRFTIPAGESHKTRATWGEVTDAMLAAGLGRDSCVVALGGGVTGDLAGFVAATYMRGVPLVQVPTTLLAMVDASIGGKVGVDTAAGKNLVGAFHQPRAVLADPAVLETLPGHELRSGLAEAVKHAAIADADHLDWIRASASSILACEPGALEALVLRSVAIKAETVSADPLESGRRKILNFGHTIGHAIEALSGYRLPHGFAIAAGMVAEAELGEAVGVTAGGTADRLRAVLSGLGLPVQPPDAIDAAAVLAAARTDKKNRQGRTRYTLLERIGRAARAPEGDWSHAIDDARALAVLTGIWDLAGG